jgi:DNA invertase Pin-like site-specific DNA recombinase
MSETTDTPSRPRYRGTVDHLRIARYYLAPVPPSRYIGHAADLPAGTKVVLFVRASRYLQDRRGNLDDQEARLRRVAAVKGWVVVCVVRRVGPGWDGLLYDAVYQARRLGAVILVETVDRLLRSHEYHSVDSPEAMPSAAEWDDLVRTLKGVAVYSVAPPDATPAENRGEQTKRGMEAKGFGGGRGNKVTLRDRQQAGRERLLPEVLRLRADGNGYGRIAALLGLKKATVQKWLRGAANGTRKG